MISIQAFYTALAKPEDGGRTAFQTIAATLYNLDQRLKFQTKRNDLSVIQLRRTFVIQKFMYKTVISVFVGVQ